MKLLAAVMAVAATLVIASPAVASVKVGSCILTGNTGWTLAQVTTRYSEGEVTQAGVSFAKFLLSLGLTGPFQLTPTA